MLCNGQTLPVLNSVKRRFSWQFLFIDARKIKPAKQLSSDMQSLWMTVDPLTRIHPNALVEEELIEEHFYIPQGDLLIASKVKEPYQQEAHIQAPAIKSKLISFTNFLSFLEKRKIHIGLNYENIKNLRYILNSCKRNLSDLCKQRLQRLKEFKSSVLINTQSLKKYGCAEHIIKLCKFLKKLKMIPQFLFL